MQILAVLQYPHMDPFIFRVGNVGLSWYSFMYVVGFVAAYFMLRYRYRHGLFKLPEKGDLSLLLTYCFYGLILGARIFYVLFYNLEYFLEHPLEIPAIWHGGMSFHGGLLGLILAVILFARRIQVSTFHILDNLCLCAPIGLGFGRIGNFINGELYGRVSKVPWAMVFPQGGPEPRHPSQLYESFLEGPVLFLILWLTLQRQPRTGIASAIFLIAYGTLRFFGEFFREPDSQLGTVIGPFSLGQVFCFAMILAGVGLLVWIQHSSKTGQGQPIEF